VQIESYWQSYPGMEEKGNYPGRLIVLEGTDGVGRSTQIRLLRRWLESSGIAVFDTGLTRSNLAGRHLRQAREGHTMGRMTQALYYATDFADRLENEIVPALRAGYVVLTDRYVYSLIARAAVRGMDPQWLRRVYGFAVKPSAIYYLKISLPELMPRVLASGGFDYWEAGADYIASEDLYECFVKHQTALLHQFDCMTEEFGFQVVDASRSIEATFNTIQYMVAEVVQEIAPVRPAKVMLEAIAEPSPERERPGDALSDLLQDFLSSLDKQS
jgi:dTMP kinase